MSIVVTSYKNEKLEDLAELLNGIKSQTYPKIEVVYVVEGSLRLFDWIKKRIRDERIPNVKILFSLGKLGLAQARNIGVKESSGEIVAFIDDDVLLCPNWAEEMTRTYALDHSLVGVTGPAEPFWEDRSMQWLPKEFYWLISCTEWSELDCLTEVRSAWGMNMSFRREVFTLSGFFDPEISGYHKPIAEDLDFSLRVRKKTGMQIVYNPKVKVWHRVYRYRFTWEFIAKRSHHIGMSRYAFRKFYGNADVASFNREYDLIKSVLRNFPTDTLKALFRNPLIFVRRVSLVLVSSLCLALGFFHGYLNYARVQRR